MPPQSVEIAGTIAALKRALRREKEAPSNQPISAATNRYNKLKRGAASVHAGALPYAYNSGQVKQKIDHAGYTRYILERNPKRYNEYGDELEDSESDVEADADADDENAYSGIRLEELLCPLKHPAELATHPTLSQPFLDAALPEMVRSTEAKLREERANLWRAKNLNRRFIGDESWMPCSNVETEGDWDLFPPTIIDVRPGSSRKRKRDAEKGDENETHKQNSVDSRDQLELSEEIRKKANKASADQMDVDKPEKFPSEKGQDTRHSTEEDTTAPEKSATNGAMEESKSRNKERNTGANDIGSKLNDNIDGPTDQNGHDDPENEDKSESHRSHSTTPPVPTRRITRALAAENDASNAPSPPLSPTPTTSSISSSLLQPDPIFLLPAHLTSSITSTPPQHHFPQSLTQLGLPIDEILETRRLLTMYIQKQEESIRGYEAVLGKLVKAKRMRDKVWEWCKAEGHVGEWSDGEDWVDAEAWGVGPGELKKGKDEDDVNNENGDEGGAGGTTGGGRKGKRRRVRE